MGGWVGEVSTSRSNSEAKASLLPTRFTAPLLASM